MARPTHLLLLLATIASAIPLRKGATLDYRVWRGKENDSCQVRITVRGSAKTDSGTLWSIGIRDSSLGGHQIRQDSALLGQTDTTLFWKRSSPLALWEALPYDSLKVRVWKAIWGEAAFYGGKSISWGGYPYFPAWDSLSRHDLYEYRSTYPQARQLWLPGIGWGRILDGVTKEQWILTAHDGIPYIWNDNDLGKLTGDWKAGTTWIWKRMSGGYKSECDYNVNQYGWSILSVLPDSGKSWVTWTIQSVLPDSQGFKRWRMEERDSIPDSATAVKIGTVGVRWTDGVELVDSGLKREPPGGLYLSWYDKPWSEANIRETDSSISQPGQTFSSKVRETSVHSFGLSTYSGRWSASFSGESGSACNAMPYFMDIDSLELVSFNGKNLTVGIRPKSAASIASLSRTNLRQALLDPKSSLQILSIDGRSVSLSRETWETELDRRRGLLLLELRTSSGTTIGKLYQP